MFPVGESTDFTPSPESSPLINLADVGLIISPFLLIIICCPAVELSIAFIVMPVVRGSTSITLLAKSTDSIAKPFHVLRDNFIYQVEWVQIPYAMCNIYIYIYMM